MRLTVIAVLCPVFFAASLHAQHIHSGPPPDTTMRADSSMSPAHVDTMPVTHDHMQMAMPGHGEPHDHMESALYFDAPMNLDGSGTSWLPDNSVMSAIHRSIGNWALMIHGSQFIRYSYQNFNHEAKRGGDKLTAPDWVMAMAHRPVGNHGKFMARAMLSFDRLTVGGSGYPLLLQTGESWKGYPLIDRQHPHDLFSELSVAYSYRVAGKTAIFGYLGYPGEPALGPTAYMHRPSAFNNADAPLSHHWQDATHIQFGVVTGGIQIGKVKFDGSLFTGREPNENRWNFDKPRFDSYSLRVSANLLGIATVQASWGFLKQPEWLEPDVDQRRTTASLIYLLPLGHDIDFTASLVWGMNDPSDFERQQSFLDESELRIHGFTFYNRWEFVQKSARELGVANQLGDRRFDVWQLTGGASQRVLTDGDFEFAVTGHLTGDIIPGALQTYYGKLPLSYSLQLRVSPRLVQMAMSGAQ